MLVAILLILVSLLGPRLTFAVEQFANAIAPPTTCNNQVASTTTSTPLNSTDATDTITVSSAIGWPTQGTFTIQIDSEGMTVTAVSGNTFTITRAEYNIETSHLAAAYVCGPILSGRAVTQIKKDLTETRLEIPFSGAVVPNQIVPFQCVDNLLFYSNFGSNLHSAFPSASCGTPPTTGQTNVYPVKVGPNPTNIVQCYGGVASGGSTTNDVVTFTGLTVSAGQSLWIFHKGFTVGSIPPVTDTATTPNTYTSISASTDACANLSYDLTPTVGTYNVSVAAQLSTSNNGVVLCEATGISALDAVNGSLFAPPTGNPTVVLTGTSQPRSINETMLGYYYAEATSPSLTGLSSNYAGPGTPTDINLNTSLGTVISNGTVAVGAVQEPGLASTTVGFQRTLNSTGTANVCGANIALLGPTVQIGAVSLTDHCVYNFTTTSGLPQTCTAGQRGEVDAPSAVSGSDIVFGIPVQIQP